MFSFKKKEINMSFLDLKMQSTKGYHSVLEQIQEIWHDTVSSLVWLQSIGKTITENQKN